MNPLVPAPGHSRASNKNYEREKNEKRFSSLLALITYSLASRGLHAWNRFQVTPGFICGCCRDNPCRIIPHISHSLKCIEEVIPVCLLRGYFVGRRFRTSWAGVWQLKLIRTSLSTIYPSTPPLGVQGFPSPHHPTNPFTHQRQSNH